MRAEQAAARARSVRLPDGSRSVQSVWIWRGFFFLALIGGGLTISFAASGRILFAAAWAFITAGWLAIAMWLWRQHVRYENGRRSEPAGR